MLESSLMSLIVAFIIGIVPENSPETPLQNNKVEYVVQSPPAIELVAIPDIVMIRLYFLPILSETEVQNITPTALNSLDSPSCSPI